MIVNAPAEINAIMINNQLRVRLKHVVRTIQGPSPIEWRFTKSTGGKVLAIYILLCLIDNPKSSENTFQTDTVYSA